MIPVSCLQVLFVNIITYLGDSSKLFTELTKDWLFLWLYIKLKLTFNLSCQGIQQYCRKFNCKERYYFNMWKGGRRGRDCMVVGFTTIYAISTYHHYRCEFESISGQVYSIQHCVIKFVSDLRQVGGFLLVPRFPPPMKTDCHDIPEILLKVTVNTLTLTLSQIYAKACKIQSFMAVLPWGILERKL